MGIGNQKKELELVCKYVSEKELELELLKWRQKGIRHISGQ